MISAESRAVLQAVRSFAWKDLYMRKTTGRMRRPAKQTCTLASCVCMRESRDRVVRVIENQWSVVLQLRTHTAYRVELPSRVM